MGPRVRGRRLRVPRVGAATVVLETGVLWAPVLVRVTTGAAVLEAGAEAWCEACTLGASAPPTAGSLPAWSWSARN